MTGLVAAGGGGAGGGRPRRLGPEGLRAPLPRFVRETPQGRVDFEHDVGQVAARGDPLCVRVGGEHGGRYVATQFVGDRHKKGGLLRG